jgi:hypothetical protein
MPRQLSNTLRDSLNERLIASSNTVRAVAAASNVNYQRLLAFSRGALPEFGIDELERLAAYLKLRLTPEPPPREPHDAIARSHAK